MGFLFLGLGIGLLVGWYVHEWLVVRGLSELFEESDGSRATYRFR